MKNHKRTLRASEAEKIRKVLDNEYLILFTDVLIAEDNVNDDPGDYDRYKDYLKLANKRLDNIEAAALLVGGLSDNMYNRAHMKAFGW